VHNSHGGFSRAEGHYLSRVTVLVLGMGPFWTQHTCGLIENEFDTACLRVDSIDSAVTIAPGLAGLRLVIVDQQHADDLVERPDAYFGLYPPASVALAYRQAEVALDLHRRYDERFGPMGYLPMNVPYEVWLSSIRLLLHREYFLPSDLRCAHEADAHPSLESPPPETDSRPRETESPGRNIPRTASPTNNQDCRLRTLTQREQEVLRLASAGHSNKLISRQLSISEHTVKLHMHHVYEKLGVSNRTAAASLLLATAGRSA
jgi:DNA-binding CsgD family transcriptional regulator